MWENTVSKFAKKTPAGFSVGNPHKMQVAINLAGLPRILLASFLGGIVLGKILGTDWGFSISIKAIALGFGVSSIIGLVFWNLSCSPSC